MSAFLKEFREFAVRGNVVDMAVGIIIGAAFGRIVSALVADVVMPPIGLLVGNIDFGNLFVNLSNTPVASLEEARAAGVPVIAYGSFVNTVIDFIIVAFVIFFLVRQINRLKRTKADAEAAPPAPSRQEVLLEEIRDLLKGPALTAAGETLDVTVSAERPSRSSPSRRSGGCPAAGAS